MVQPVRLELTTNRLKVYCAAIAPRLHLKELQYSILEYCLCQEEKIWEQVLDLHQRSSRYERDEIDYFSNLLLTHFQHTDSTPNTHTCQPIF